MEKITIKTTVQVPADKAWELWTTPEHICRWNAASDDWHTTWAENNLHIEGTFCTRMEAKDGSAGFDFEGVYDDLILHKLLSYTIVDGRKVTVQFDNKGDATEIIEIFEPEQLHDPELQKEGWQSILNNFKSYAESV